MIYIFSSQKPASLGLSDKSTWAKVLQLPHNMKILEISEIQANDQVYLDISSLSSSELKKILGSLKKSRPGSFWGIIDPKGAAEDPALFFFDSACDYIGPALVKKGLNKKRFDIAFSNISKAKAPSSTAKDQSQSMGKQKSATSPSSKVKLPTSKFEGWKSIHSGATAPFFFLFVSLPIKSQAREAAFNAVKNRLRDVLQQALSNADALLWMDKENTCLFLVPARAPNAMAAIEAALKVILNSRIICVEKLGISHPVDFTFAMHYGKTLFRAPGKTGSVVSEAVNYIYHLGEKQAEAGRLTISDEVPEEVLPKGLRDLFSPVGDFEGIAIRHSKRFVYQ
ncbi:MAG: hypothetical protein FWD87_03885 [Spirochaetaceae bacterium]|nr:hypothetical protein [Spirochaetaceae bacterium]